MSYSALLGADSHTHLPVTERNFQLTLLAMSALKPVENCSSSGQHQSSRCAEPCHFCLECDSYVEASQGEFALTARIPLRRLEKRPFEIGSKTYLKWTGNICMFGPDGVKVASKQIRYAPTNLRGNPEPGATVKVGVMLEDKLGRNCRERN